MKSELCVGGVNCSRIGGMDEKAKRRRSKNLVWRKRKDQNVTV